MGVVLVVALFFPLSLVATGLDLEELGKAWAKRNELCTAFIVDPKGSVDGSTMTTHTNDCYNCDFRIAKIPAKDWPPNSTRPIHEFRIAYPRYVGYDRGEVYYPENTESTYHQWNTTQPIGYIPQVSHTFSYVEGTYGLLNEHQLAMGESTCSAKIAAGVPVSHGGNALMEIGELSRIAMERCKTARCAITTMGGLAETYGYYGANWVGSQYERMLEAGEAMTVADPTEAWVFHILPDPTGKSAVWAAQRVPEGHFAMVANEFIIHEMDLENKDYFLASSNILAVAIETNLWDPTTGPFNFMRTYTFGHPFQKYCQRRQWRGLSLAAPSLNLDSETDEKFLPFSVPVDTRMSKDDFFRLLRDHYEGTPYDMTKGLSSGPYGNPNRYDMGVGSGTPIEVVFKGSFERAISIFRAQYSYVTLSRAHLPDEIGAMMWFGHYAPHSSVFFPIYASAPLPKSVQVGSLYALNRDSSYWAFCTIGNWLEKYYKFIIEDINIKQKELESLASETQIQVENKALQLYQDHDIDGAIASLREWTLPFAKTVLEQGWDLFEYLIVRYHDGYKFENLNVEYLNPIKLFYPFWWLEQVGYFKPDGSRVPKYMSDSPESLNITIISTHPNRLNFADTQPCVSPPVSSLASTLVTIILSGVVFFTLGTLFGRRSEKYSYQELSDTDL